MSRASPRGELETSYWPLSRGRASGLTASASKLLRGLGTLSLTIDGVPLKKLFEGYSILRGLCWDHAPSKGWGCMMEGCSTAVWCALK